MQGHSKGDANHVVSKTVSHENKFAVSYSFFSDRTPFLQHAAISASMAVIRPLDSLADVDMVDVAWVFFVPRPSA